MIKKNFLILNKNYKKLNYLVFLIFCYKRYKRIINSNLKNFNNNKKSFCNFLFLRTSNYKFIHFNIYLIIINKLDFKNFLNYKKFIYRNSKENFYNFDLYKNNFKNFKINMKILKLKQKNNFKLSNCYSLYKINNYYSADFIKKKTKFKFFKKNIKNYNNFFSSTINFNNKNIFYLKLYSNFCVNLDTKNNFESIFKFKKINKNLNLIFLKYFIKSIYNQIFFNYIYFFKVNTIYFFNWSVFMLPTFKSKGNYNFNLQIFLKYLLFIIDKNIIEFKNINYNFMSNKYIRNFFNFFENNYFLVFDKNINKNIAIYNNYYPIIFSNKISRNSFFSKFRNNYNIDYILFTNKFVISFLEKFFKKFIFIKYINNFFNKLNNYYLNSIIEDHKNFQPAFWKNFLVKDFIKILWYSFLLKDLTMISGWISIFMEILHFKNHKKFLSFFFNFMNKYSSIFMDVLKLKGFFFDIRGKVGVTGSSKKRHLSFRFGSINKSSKKTKINFSQNLVRTYSGVLGLTYIINF